ncbi:glycosyltransferase family 39 protein [Patescibacteria group bacterium]|nr:glycosyltransferase family 39 protein [Patescibacteria group bacterium]
MLQKLGVRKYLLVISLLVVLLTAAFWRFINFDNRLTLSQDQARDAIIAQYSIENNVFPLVGPPSSAGPFSFGPVYYWLIMGLERISPAVNFPWIGFAFISVLTVLVYFLIGYFYQGLKFALILGLLASFASAAVFHSVDMLNPMPIPFLVCLLILSIVLMEKSQSIWWAILTGASLSLAINFHFEAIGLLITPIFFTLVKQFSWRKRILSVMLSYTAALIFLLPIFLLGKNTTIHLIGYFLTPGTSIKLLNNPFKEVLSFWPKLWGEVITFQPWSGYLILVFVGLAIIFGWIKKYPLQQSWWVLFCLLVSQAILLYFYQGAKSPVYLLFLHPLITFFTGWAVWTVWNKNSHLGLGIFAIFLLGMSFYNLTIIKGNTQKPLIYQIKASVQKRYQPQQVSIYQTANSEMISLPFYYLYMNEHRIADSGHKFGLCDGKDPQKPCPQNPVPVEKFINFYIYDLQSIPDAEIQGNGFEPVAAAKIYQSVANY